jgi:hypothetical protein
VRVYWCPTSVFFYELGVCLVPNICICTWFVVAYYLVFFCLNTLSTHREVRVSVIVLLFDDAYELSRSACLIVARNLFSSLD